MRRFLINQLFGGLIVAGICSAQTPVILISIDTLRGDRVGVHTPGIESFARNGTVFTAAETQVPLTLPSHTTLLTSTWPFQNGVEENAGKIPPGMVTLASVLRGRGYKTAAFIGSIFLEKELGLDQGFDTYDSPFHFEAFSKLSGEMLFGGKGSAYAVRERRPGALVLRAANQWLGAHRGEPVFVFVHLFDMHKPWQRGSYDGQLAEVDRLLAGFRETLQREGWWDRSLVALVADHGEGLGDHGESDHGYFVYESTLHVPLIIHWPAGAVRLPARVAQPVGLIDVAPTILDFLKIPAPASFHGRSVLDGSPQPVLSESVYARDSFGWAALRSVREGSWKYIDAPKPELYNLATDPRELNNVVKTSPAEAKRLRAALPAVKGSPGQSGGDPQRKKEVLESLGYLAPGPQAVKKGAAADPKERLPELLRYEDALQFMGERRYDAAIAAFRAILTADPGNLLARRDLGVALNERRDFRNAQAELERVASASSDDYVTRYELGLANEGLGQFREALDQFEYACRIAPGATQCQDAVARVREKLGAKRSPRAPDRR